MAQLTVTVTLIRFKKICILYIYNIYPDYFCKILISSVMHDDLDSIFWIDRFLLIKMKYAESVSQSWVKQNLVHYPDGEWRIRKTWVLFDSGKLKTYCCQFETFAKLGADREGGCCALCEKFPYNVPIWKWNDIPDHQFVKWSTLNIPPLVSRRTRYIVPV